MTILEDVFSSIKGHARTRVSDPILGTFIVSWSVCNWDKIGTLFWGSKSVDVRINELVKSMSIIQYPSIIYQDLDLLIFPLLLTIVYIFFFPKASLWVKKIQKATVVLQHVQAINLDIEKAKNQKKLNKEILMSNPNKDYLAKELDIELEVLADKLERRKKLTAFIDAKKNTAQSKAELQKIELENKRIEADKKLRQDTIEKIRHDKSLSMHKATLASNRFPSAFHLIDSLSSSLMGDDVFLPVKTVSECIAAVFGYDNFHSLINDPYFNNETVNQLRFVYHDSAYLAKRLDEVLLEMQEVNESANSDLIFEHIQMILEERSILLKSADFIAEDIGQRINDSYYDILSSEELSGPMAETDSIFEELELEIERFNFDTVFKVCLSGIASGYHRKESDVGGQDINVNIVATCNPIIGKYGLKDYELEIHGETA